MTCPSVVHLCKVKILQGENPPTVGTLIRATAAVREFRRTGDFELVFKPIDYMSAGICAVSDAALGNVKLNGSSAGTSKTHLLPSMLLLLHM